MNLEKQILGELLNIGNNDRIEALCLLEKPGLFEDYRNEEILKAISIMTLQGKAVDFITVYQALKNKFEPAELDEINSLGNKEPNLWKHIRLLQERKYKKELQQKIRCSLELLNQSTFADDIEDVKSNLIAELCGLNFDDKSDFVDLDEQNELLKKQLESDKKIEGFSWGITDLDKWTSGIVSPRMYVLGGLKKSGKTRFVIHTLKELHNQGVPSAFISLEMPPYEINKLLRASFANIDDLRLRSSSYLKSEEKELLESVNINESLLGIECKSGLRIEQILSRLRRYSKLGFKVVFIDYIQRIDHDRNRQAQQLEDISVRIADSARLNNIAVVLLSQLNVQGEREIPSIAHLKGSGGIGEAADTVLLLDNLYRRTKREADKNKINIYIEQRYGDSGTQAIQCDLGCIQFRNFSTLEESNV